MHVSINRESPSPGTTATPSPNHHFIHDDAIATAEGRWGTSPTSVAAICTTDLQTITTLFLAVLPKEMLLLMLSIAWE